MTSDTKWDVSKYWSPHEVPIFWEMKKKFLIANKDKLPEDNLVCMSQIYYNMKVLGCRYEKNIMDEVNKLAEGIDDVHQGRRSKYEQTFVRASDAIQAKVQRLRNPIPQSSGQQQGGSSSNYIPFVKSSDDFQTTQKNFGPFREGYVCSMDQNSEDKWTPPQRFMSQQDNPDQVDGSLYAENIRPEHENCKYIDDGKAPLPVPKGMEVRKRKSTKRKSTDPPTGSIPKILKIEEPPIGDINKNVKKSKVIDLTDSPAESSRPFQPAPQYNSNRPQYNRKLFLARVQYTWIFHDDGNEGLWTTVPIKARRFTVDPKEVLESGPFGRVVVFENSCGDSPHSIISRTASAARMETTFSFTKEGGEVSCRMKMGGLFLASATARTEKLARELACRTAIERLKETSFTVQIKAPYVGGSVRIDRTLKSSEKPGQYRADIDVPIEEKNVGRKIMMLMGWTGGGLGKNEQGLEEPIRPDDVSVKRSGLGIKSSRDFKQKVANLLRDYCQNDSKNDLVFSSEFSKDERKLIHELVRKFNLKSRSFGKEEDKRHIVVFKKINPHEIVEDLIKCGGETEKYVLIPPSSI